MSIQNLHLPRKPLLPLRRHRLEAEYPVRRRMYRQLLKEWRSLWNGFSEVSSFDEPTMGCCPQVRRYIDSLEKYEQKRGQYVSANIEKLETLEMVCLRIEKIQQKATESDYLDPLEDLPECHMGECEDFPFTARGLHALIRNEEEHLQLLADVVERNSSRTARLVRYFEKIFKEASKFDELLKELDSRFEKETQNWNV